MLGNIDEIILQAQNDFPKAGVVVYDCNQHDVFYIPQSDLHLLRDNLSTQDQARLDVAQAEHLENEEILVVTIHDNKLVDLATFQGQDNLAQSCPVDS